MKRLNTEHYIIIGLLVLLVLDKNCKVGGNIVKGGAFDFIKEKY